MGRARGREGFGRQTSVGVVGCDCCDEELRGRATFDWDFSGDRVDSAVGLFLFQGEVIVVIVSWGGKEEECGEAGE